MSERFLTIIYLIFAQSLPLTTFFVFDKFFLRSLPVSESCLRFIWQMTRQIKENISINTTKKPRSQRRTSGLQCSFNECQNGYYCADGKRSMFHFFTVPLKNPDKAIWCNKMGKVVTKKFGNPVLCLHSLSLFLMVSKLNMVFLILSFVAFNSFLVFLSSVFSRMFSRLTADVEAFTTSREVSKSDLDKINPKQLSITGKTRKKNLSKTSKLLRAVFGQR